MDAKCNAEVKQRAWFAAETMPKNVLALGYLRYEVLRKLSPRDFTVLFDRNLSGENFDSMIDEMISRLPQ